MLLMWNTCEFLVIYIYTRITKNKTKITLSGLLKKLNSKIVERGKIDTLSAHIHDQSLSWLGTSTSIENGRIYVVLWAQTLHKTIFDCTLNIFMIEQHNVLWQC